MANKKIYVMLGMAMVLMVLTGMVAIADKLDDTGAGEDEGEDDTGEEEEECDCSTLGYGAFFVGVIVGAAMMHVARG